MAMPIPTYKVCVKHGEIVEELRYYYKTTTGKTSFRCKPCMNAQSRLFKKLNPGYHKQPHIVEKHKIATKIWAQKNPDKVREKNKRNYHKAKEWYHANKHTEQYKIMKRAANIRNRNAKKDHYNYLSALRHSKYTKNLNTVYLNKIIKLRGLRDLPNQEEVRQWVKSMLLMKRKIKELTDA